MSDTENKKSEKKHQRYEAPAIIFEEVVEAVATTCSSALTAGVQCRYDSTGTCDATLL